MCQPFTTCDRVSSCTAMPELSSSHQLKFCGSAKLKHITCLGTHTVIDHACGQVVYDEHGHFVSARLPASERLTEKQLKNFDDLLTAWARRGRYTRRGDAHAAVCENFVMGGLKGDQDTCMAMPSSLVAEDEHAQKAYLNVMSRLREFLKEHVLPRIERYLFTLIDCMRDPMHAAGLRHAFVDYFTSISMGERFVPRNHVDEDLWVTAVIAAGSCAHGAEWAHPEQGVAHAVHAGDILVVNPAYSHCTATMQDPEATRRMLALFVSDNALKASLTSLEVARAEGLEAYTPHEIHARKRKRNRGSGA